MANFGNCANGGSLFLAVATSNFVPLVQPSSADHPAPSSPYPSSSSQIKQLPIFIGDRLRVLAHNGEWCYGHRIGESDQCGMFPKIFVRSFRQRKKAKSSETEELLEEVTQAIKYWWKCTKSFYGAVNSNPDVCDDHIRRIRELMTLRRRIRSGTIPTEELRELRLNVAKQISLGNAALHLPMQIRDQTGRIVRIEEMSISSVYKRHEEAHAQIVAQQSANALTPTDEGTVAMDTVANREYEQIPTANGSALLVTIQHPQHQLPTGNVEIVIGLGRRTTRISGQHRSPTRPISEPLTIFLNGNEKGEGKPKSSRVLFVGLTESEVRDEPGTLTLWATLLRVAPLVTSGGTLGKSGTGDEVRQFYAHGQVELGEHCADMAEKEQRELNLGLIKKSDQLPAICQLPSGSSASVPYTAQSSGSAGRERIPLSMTIQLFRADRVRTMAELKNVQILHKMKENDEGGEGREARRKRNEVFIWLRSADLHGVGRSEKNVEASISVVDDEGVFQPEAIEIVTPEGPRWQSSFRCRVWFSEDRPKLNELIKIRLPEAEVRNLHLQILFYNKSTSNDKKIGFPSASSKTPFALAFLRLITNYVLCADDEDELFLYKMDKSSKSGSSASDGTRPINVAYLAHWAKRKELRASGTGGRSPSVATLTRMESLQLGTGGALYTLQSDKNGVQFVSFVCSSVHTTNPTLLQIMRWRDNELQLGQRLQELCLSADLGEQWAEELFKFLPNVLDALFQIADAVPYMQRGVFDALVHLCRICEECAPNCSRRLKPELEQYIRGMHFPNAHGFLLKNTIWYIENEGLWPPSSSPGPYQHGPVPSSPSSGHDKLLPVLKSLHTIIQLAISSKRCGELIEKSGPGTQKKLHDGKMGDDEFVSRMDQLTTALAQMLESPTRRMTCQNVALKHLAFLVGPLASNKVYDPIHLTKYVLKVLDSLAEGVLMRQRLHFIGELIQTELFSYPECRQLLLDRFLDELIALMPPHLREEEDRTAQSQGIRKRRDSVTAALDSSNTTSSLEAVQLSARILLALMDRLFPHQSLAAKTLAGFGTRDELCLVLRKCLRPLNQTMVTLLGDPIYQRTLHALLLALLDKFSAEHFHAYFRSLRNQLERLDTLSEMLHLFRDLLMRSPVPPEWLHLRRVQLRLFAKHLRFAAALIRRDFGTPATFECGIWLECMLSCVTLAKCAASPTAEQADVSDGEQLMEEGYAMSNGPNEVAHQTNGHALSEYSAEILRSLWFSLLPESKTQLMSDMVGPVLEMAFAGSRLRELAIPIFADMLATEHLLTSGSTVVLRRRAKEHADLVGTSIGQPQHPRFIDLFIRRLDPFLDFALGDVPFQGFRKAFSRLFLQYCQHQNGPSKSDNFVFRSFVQRVDRLLELFAAYRSVQDGSGDAMAELGMFCTAQLVDFYQSIEQHSLYVLYLYKLYMLHITTGEWVEAALTLKRHADLLQWSPDRPASWLCGSRKQNAEFGSQLELKEHIYREMAELFERGDHWELAVETNRELANICETMTFDYAKLADLLTRNATLYEKVTKTIRFESHYFLVAFYGKNCPAYLAKRKFVFRGHPLEQWGCFKQRLAANFAEFKFLESLDDCDETHSEAEGKFLQIVPVSPVPLKETYAQLLQSPCRLASWYYKHHRVQRFELVRREFRLDTKWTRLEDNEATRLWLHKRIIQIQRPLPDLLSFGPVVSECGLEASNPVEVAIDKMREANDKLAETAALVAEGFAQQLVNLAGMIRGMVQADVGGGIRNYQAFFSEESRAQCTEEEWNSIAALRRLILEQTALLEYALFIHAQSDQARSNPMFHNSLAGSFIEHRHRVEHRFGEVKSVLPESASIYVLDSVAGGGGGGSKGTMSPKSMRERGQIGQLTMTPKPAKINNNQQQQHLSNYSSGNHQQALRPISTGSNSGASSSTTTTSSASFKNSPLSAAHSLIKTTIQGKSKQKSRNSAKKAKTTTDLRSPAHHKSAQQLSTGQQEMLSAISQVRMSDTSVDTFLMEECIEPPLPPRLSGAHSDEMRPKHHAKATRK